MTALALALALASTSSVTLPSEPVRVPVQTWIDLEVERRSAPLQSLAGRALEDEAGARSAADTALLVAAFASLVAIGFGAALVVVASSK